MKRLLRIALREYIAYVRTVVWTAGMVGLAMMISALI